MATLAGIRARVRVRLEESSAGIWTDAELDEGIAAALEAFGLRAPLEVITASSVPEGSRSAALPGGTRQVLRVELEDGRTLPPRTRRVGEEATPGWEMFADALRFSHPLRGQTLRIWHTASPTLEQLLPSDEGVVVLGAVACALQARALQDAKRGGPGTSAGVQSLQAVVNRAEQAFAVALDRRTRRARLLA